MSNRAATQNSLASDRPSADGSVPEHASAQCCPIERGEIHLEHWNRSFERLDAPGRIRCALEHLPGTHVLTSSFGAQAAVSLHLLTQEQPDIPVILLDTGYLFPETYRFLGELSERLNLNLQTYRSRQSPAWQEALYGE